MSIINGISGGIITLVQGLNPTARKTITVVNKETDGTTDNTTVYTTGAISWNAGDLLVIGINADNIEEAPSTVVTTGLTWTKLRDSTVLSGSRVLSVWYAKAAAAGTSQVTTITYISSQIGCCWTLVAAANTAATGYIVQDVEGGGGVSSDTVTSTLAAFENENNVNLTLWGGFTGSGEPTPDSDFTELGSAHITSGVNDIESQWATNETVNTTTTTTPFNQTLVSLELKAA